MDDKTKKFQALAVQEKEKRFSDWTISLSIDPIKVDKLLVERQISLLLGKKVITKQATFIGESPDFSDHVSGLIGAEFININTITPSYILPPRYCVVLNDVVDRYGLGFWGEYLDPMGDKNLFSRIYRELTPSQDGGIIVTFKTGTPRVAMKYGRMYGIQEIVGFSQEAFLAHSIFIPEEGEPVGDEKKNFPIKAIENQRGILVALFRKKIGN